MSETRIMNITFWNFIIFQKTVYDIQYRRHCRRVALRVDDLLKTFDLMELGYIREISNVGICRAKKQLPEICTFVQFCFYFCTLLHIFGPRLQAQEKCRIKSACVCVCVCVCLRVSRLPSKQLSKISLQRDKPLVLYF